MAKKTVSLTDAALPVLGAVIDKSTRHIPILQFVKVTERDSQRIAYATNLDTWAEVRV